MAKKFVRGITDIKEINKQDFDTNNVNDLLSDGEHNYIHRKKGNSEEYHNLTDNIKTVSSDNTDLLEVTNNNNTSNSVTLHPKHDPQKQDTIQGNASIGIYGQGLRQLYALKQSYTNDNGILKTHVKAVSEYTNVYNAHEEFNFIVKINKGVSSVNFTLNVHDTTKFANIINEYGENNTVCISGCVFTLSESTLTVSTANNTEQNYVITFSDII